MPAKLFLLFLVFTICNVDEAHRAVGNYSYAKIV
jgi:ERCC4-related helicase